MAAPQDTFGNMYRGLRLWTPDLPIFLAKQLIRDRYRRALERRIWSALRAESEFITNASKTAGTVTLTRSSATVTGSGTAFAASDIGRQFQAGNRAPTYTITAVGSTTSLTLDRVFGDDDLDGSGVSYRILDAYVTCPADFKSFIVVYDPKQNWRLRHFMTQDDISRLDPARTAAGTNPWALIDRRPSTLTSTLGQATYELWPYTTSARNFPFYYEKQGADLVDDDDFPEIPIRGDVLVRGALADVCRWPGSVERPNPMFNLKLAESWEKEFQDQLAELERQDENMYMTWLDAHDWNQWPYAPIDAAFLQSHAF